MTDWRWWCFPEVKYCWMLVTRAYTDGVMLSTYWGDGVTPPWYCYVINRLYRKNMLSLFYFLKHTYSDGIHPFFKLYCITGYMTPCCYIAFITWYIKESYASIQTKISKFQRHFRILRFCKIEILHNLDERTIA